MVERVCDFLCETIWTWILIRDPLVDIIWVGIHVHQSLLGGFLVQFMAMGHISHPLSHILTICVRLHVYNGSCTKSITWSHIESPQLATQ